MKNIIKLSVCFCITGLSISSAMSLPATNFKSNLTSTKSTHTNSFDKGWGMGFCFFVECPIMASTADWIDWDECIADCL